MEGGDGVLWVWGYSAAIEYSGLSGDPSLSSVTYSLMTLGKGDPVQASLSNWEDYLR